jgi:hypothetical protein
MHRLSVIVLVIAASLGINAQEAPQESGLVESTSAELVLIDVDARDPEGNPRHGLKAENFAIFLNGRELPIESVDDLSYCGRSASLDAAHKRSSGFRRPSRHFVLYFDLSQTGPAARQLASKEARRWIQSLQPDTWVTVAAYSQDKGVHVLADRTNPEKAAAAVVRIAKGRRFDDNPELARRAAADLCDERSPDLKNCLSAARDQLERTRESLTSLLFYLTQLEATPESKSLLLFHQSLTADPATALFDGVDRAPSGRVRYGANGEPLPTAAEVVRTRVGDQWALLRELAGTAFVSRTRVYPITLGSGRWSVNLGANLAQMTGGSYNTSLEDLRETMIAARDACPSTYRIGIRPRTIGVEKRSQLKVLVNGDVLLSLKDIRIPDTADRWRRTAKAVLAHPDRARDLPLGASIRPTFGIDGSWNLDAIVQFDLRALEMIPEADRVKGKWEVGAILIHTSSGKSWEMLGVSAIRAGRKPEDPARLVHQQRFESMRPGEYELRAFIRDRWANLFGGSLATLELPKPKAGLIVTPQLMDETEYLLTTLPLRKKKIQRDHRNAASKKSGLLPFSAGDFGTDARSDISVVSWGCAKEGDLPSVMLAQLVGEGGSIDLPTTVAGEGRCREATSRIDLAELPAGEYEYVVHWLSGDRLEPRVASRPIRVSGR